VRLIMTVDVEEDQWGATQDRQATTENIRHLPALDSIFREFKVVPTYFVTFPVVSDDGATAILRHSYESGQCEIGMHCHPWTTPPFEERITRYNTMLCNLDPLLQERKLRSLYERIVSRLRTHPIAYRAGRWGYGAHTARILDDLACRIDSSMTPFTSWTHSDGPNYSRVTPRPYRFFAQDIFTERASGSFIEVPVSIGYLHGDFQSCSRLAERLACPPFRQWRFSALLAHFGILRKVWLSPEQETTRRLIQLVNQMTRRGYSLLNVVFHSSSLLSGCNPFVQSARQREAFLTKVRRILAYCQDRGIVFERLSNFRPYAVTSGGIRYASEASIAAAQVALSMDHSPGSFRHTNKSAR
jgi:hypothetical protein